MKSSTLCSGDANLQVAHILDTSVTSEYKPLFFFFENTVSPILMSVFLCCLESAHLHQFLAEFSLKELQKLINTRILFITHNSVI